MCKGITDDQKILNRICYDLLEEQGLLKIDFFGDIIFNAACAKYFYIQEFNGRCVSFGLKENLANPLSVRMPSETANAGGNGTPPHIFACPWWILDGFHLHPIGRRLLYDDIHKHAQRVPLGIKRTAPCFNNV